MIARLVAIVLVLIGLFALLDSFITFAAVSQATPSGAPVGFEVEFRRGWELGKGVGFMICLVKFAVGMAFIGFGFALDLLAALVGKMRVMETFAERIAWRLDAPTVNKENPFASK